MATSAANERALRKLESKYATPTEKHIQEYSTDVAEITRLHKEGIIDRDHAELFLGRAKAKRDEAAAKIKEAREREAEELAANSAPTKGFWERCFAA